MKLKESVISIVLPVHNAERFLPACLLSLKKQTYKNLQIIAIDDKSTDSSYKILKKFQKKLKTLEVHRNKKRYGLAICYNRAIKRSRGQFITFTNPNDINNPDKLRRQINFLLQNPKTVAVGTQYSRISEDNTKLGKSQMPKAHDEIYNNLLQSKAMQPETIMINRTLIPKDLLCFKSNRYPILFKEVFVKLFQYGDVANIGHSLYYHRVGIKRHARQNSRLKHTLDHIELWLRSWTQHDYRPSVRSLLPPLVRGV